jgi:hypothetical protein
MEPQMAPPSACGSHSEKARLNGRSRDMTTTAIHDCRGEAANAGEFACIRAATQVGLPLDIGRCW